MEYSCFDFGTVHCQFTGYTYKNLSLRLCNQQQRAWSECTDVLALYRTHGLACWALKLTKQDLLMNSGLMSIRGWLCTGGWRVGRSNERGGLGPCGPGFFYRPQHAVAAGTCWTLCWRWVFTVNDWHRQTDKHSLTSLVLFVILFSIR